MRNSVSFLSRLAKTALYLVFILTASVFPASPALADQVTPALLFAPVPDIDIEIKPLESVLIGENFYFYLTFDETSVDVGYRPFIDLLFPSNGMDGAAGTDTPDGIDFVEASYLGVALNAVTQTFPDDDGITLPGMTGCVDHPFARDAAGDPLQVCATAGDTLVTLELPFSSITTDMPELWIKVEAGVSELADVDQPLAIKTRAGYANGSDPLNNPVSDPVVVTHVSTDGTGWPELVVTPQVIYIEKVFDGPMECPYLLVSSDPVLDESLCPYGSVNPVYETVTGPNYPRHYTIKVDVAAGQTVTDLNVTDYFPNNMAFVNLDSTTPAGTATSTPVSGVAANSPANELVVNFASLSVDAQLVVEFFIPELDADNNPVIDPATGDEAVTDNIASAVGDWVPVDPRDTNGPDNALANACPGCDSLHTLHLRSMAVQKTVSIETDNGVSGYSPGDLLKYTIEFQISDYFTFGDIEITDVLYDGQRIDLTAGNEPTFSISERNTTLTDVGFTYTVPPGAPAPGDDLIIDLSQIGNTGPGPDATDGSTTLVFDISTAMTNNGQLDGILEGGEVGTSAIPAEGSIVFYAIVQEDFSDEYPSGDPSVDHGDKHYNYVTALGSVRDNTSITTVIGSEDNESTTKFEIEHGHITKLVYAVNGSTTFTPEIQPGDTITFQLIYPLPSSDSDTLVINDYLPLPIFDATEITAFDDVTSGTPPAAGHAQFGAGDTFRVLFGPTALPTVTADAVLNTLAFDFSSFDDPTDTTTEIEILFTVTMSDEPYANGTLLSNLNHSLEDTTNNDVHTSAAIDQFTLKEPGINLRKGVVATNNPDATFVPDPPGPVSFNPPGSSTSWSGVIGSADQDPLSDLINSDVFEVGGGDLVTFAVVLENLGDSTLGAFDLSVRDTIPAGMSIPAGGLNLQIRRGDGAAMTNSPVGSTATDPSGLFDDGIVFADDSASVGAAHVYHPSNGENIIVITYDLQIDAALTFGTQLVNTATLLSYAGTDGGPNHVGATPTNNIHTDDALATLLPPGIIVGPTGGTVRSGRWEVTVPAGLLQDGSLVSIVEIDPSTGQPLGPNVQRLGTTAEIRIYDRNGVSLTSFDPPLQVCYYYSASDVNSAGGDPDNLIINTAANQFSAWVRLQTYVNPSGGKVCALVDHLSLFTVTAINLPVTGFAPGVVTTLEAQPAEKAYASLGDLWLEIPSLKVELPIVGVPQSPGGWDVSWLGNQAGFLTGTAFPTLPGNTAITAHVFDVDGRPGPFVNLHSLSYGDTVVIHAWGYRYTYQVRLSNLISPNNMSVLGHEDFDWVTLLTCQGFDQANDRYRYRYAVQAVLVDVGWDQ